MWPSTTTCIGDVAVNEDLELFSGNPAIRCNDTNGSNDRVLNNGGIRFQFADNTLGTAWRFQAVTGKLDRFEVARVGTGRIEFFIDDLGNGFVAGDLDVRGDLLTNVPLPSDYPCGSG